MSGHTVYGACNGTSQSDGQECGVKMPYLAESSILRYGCLQPDLPDANCNTDNEKTEGVLPASAPYLKLEANIVREEIDLISEDVSTLFAKWWPKNPELITRILSERFPPIPITWDLEGVQGYSRDSAIALIPGKR